MQNDISPIGMFDSGIGGLTVMHELIKVLPFEDVVYFGDTARLPYGGKSKETIVRYSIESAIFLIEKKVKIVVVACNTAASQALDKLQQIFSLPVVGVIDPGAKHAVEITKNGCIAVLGTKGTIQSEAYQKAILAKDPNATVYSIPCPLFVPLVEEDCLHHPAARLIVQEYLKPLKSKRVDTVLLGCTHYPLLKDLIRDELGNDVQIVDSATSCAEEVKNILGEKSLKNCSRNASDYHYYVSDDPHKFKTLGKAFLKMPINHVEAVSRLM